MKKERLEHATARTAERFRPHGSNFGALLPATALSFATLCVARLASAADYYVAPTGNDSAEGTMAAPWATLSKAASTASAGDTVYFREGTYPITSQARLSRSGTSDDNRIRFFAHEGEHATLDCSGYQSTNRAADTPCILITGSYLHIKGFEIIGAPVGARGDHSISTLRSNDASNNTYELLDLHHGFGPGLFIDAGNGGNLILNCDAHDNYDKDGSQGDGQNGDGFGVHYQMSGPSTIIRGCRAWLNSDDGYDLISQEVPVTIEDSWAFQNGYADGGSTSPSSGNGNGFKVGSSKTGIRHLVQNNVAWNNKASGFYANHSSGGNTWFNNTSYMNGTQYNMLASTWDAAGNRTDGVILMGEKVHRMTNNVGFPERNSNMGGVEMMNNTWDLGIAEANAFVSTDDSGVTGPRKPDGGLPDLEFLKPKADGVLIDRGVDVMLPYVGSAPDLGAYEYGASTGGGMAGAAGAGGAGGSGGADVVGGMAGSGGMTDGAGSSSGGAQAGGGASLGGGAGMPVAGGPGDAGSGAVATGGTSGGPGTSTAGRSAGGVGPFGGAAAVAGSGAFTPAGDTANASGCACRLPSRSESRTPIQFLTAGALGLLALARTLRRRGRQRTRR